MPVSNTGLVVDGRRVAVVVAAQGRVLAAHLVERDTPGRALQDALKLVGRAGDIRAVVLEQGARAERIDITDRELSRAEFTDLARRATGAPAAGSTAAGLFFDIDAVKVGALSAALAATAPEGTIAALYRHLPLGRRTEIVPAPFVVEQEGLSLALCHATAELTLVSGGHPVAYKQLAVGGLDIPAASLGAQDNIGAERLQAALTSSADVIATHALDRYLADVLDEVRATIAIWQQRGEQVGGELHIHGPGARARSLDVLLDDAGLTRAAHSEAYLALSASPASDRASLVAAYWAATSFGTGSPQAVYPDPALVRPLARRARRGVTLRRARIVGYCALVIAAAVAIPLGFAAYAQQEATTVLETAEQLLPDAFSATEAEHLMALEDVLAELPASAAAEETVRQIRSLAPAGITLTSIDAQLADRVQRAGNPGAIRARIEATGKQAAVDAFLDALGEQGTFKSVIPESMVPAGPDVDVTITLIADGGE